MKLTDPKDHWWDDDSAEAWSTLIDLAARAREQKPLVGRDDSGVALARPSRVTIIMSPALYLDN